MPQQLLAQAVGINLDNPTETLDVDGAIRIRGMKDIEDKFEYNGVIMANSNGVIGSNPYVSQYTFGDIFYSRMDNQVQSTPSNMEVFLNLKKEIVIPPKKKYLVVLEYSVPIFIWIAERRRPSYVGIKLKKTTGGGMETDMVNSWSGFTTPVITTGASAQGNFVANKTIDVIENNTTEPIVVTYKAFGFSQDYVGVGTSGIVNFGLLYPTGENYNWGRGLFTILTFAKNL